MHYTGCLYLCRHGEALSAQSDDERPLSPKGIAETKRIASAIKALELPISQILHSPKLRAKQTASHIQATLKLSHPLVENSDCLPESSPQNFISLLSDMPANTMIVSHLPFIPRLAASLLGVSENSLWFNLPPSTCLSLECDPAGAWYLKGLFSV